MRILVVDDEPKIRRGLEMLIKHIDNKYEVEIADDGDTGLEAVRGFCPSIVFVDMKMPTMDGLTFIKHAKEINENIRFIVVSGYAEFEFAREAMEYGVIDYILKPIMPERIEKVLNKAVECVKQKENNDLDKQQLKERFLIDSIYKEDELVNINDKLSIKNSFIVVVGVYGQEKESKYQYTISKNEKVMVKGMITAILTQYGKSTVTFHDNELIAIVSIPCLGHLKTCRFIKEEIKNIGYEYISLGVSNIGDSLSINNIKKAYKECLEDMGGNDDKLIVNNLSGIVLKMINYIKSNYSGKIKLIDIADYVYMHPTNVSKIFKKETGMNLTDYIVQYRIKKSKQMLCNPAYKIYDVADMVGFSSPKYFINVFKSKTGMTPNEFRSKNIK